MTMTAMMEAAQFFDAADRTLDLVATRHQGGAIFERPAIILHMRDLDPRAPMSSAMATSASIRSILAR